MDASPTPRRPKLQRWVRYGAYFLAGVIGLGTLLDSVGNASQLPLPLAIVLTAGLVVCCVMLEVVARARGIPWRSDGVNLTVKRMGISFYMGCAGMAALIWGGFILGRTLSQAPKGNDASERTQPTPVAVAKEVEPPMGVGKKVDPPRASLGDYMLPAIPFADVVHFEDLVSGRMRCVDFYEGGNGEHIIAPTPARVDMCNPPSVTFVRDYLGTVGGFYFCAFTSNQYSGALARNHLLVPAGSLLYSLGCESRIDGDIQLRASRARVLGCTVVESAEVAVDELPIADVDHRIWKTLKLKPYLLEASIDPHGHVEVLNVNVAGHLLQHSVGVNFSANCSDFPSYLVVRAASLTEEMITSADVGRECPVPDGKERLVKVELMRGTRPGTTSIAVSECEASSTAARD